MGGVAIARDKGLSLEVMAMGLASAVVALFLLYWTASGSSDDGGGKASRGTLAVSLSPGPTVSLTDGSWPILATPVWIAEHPVEGLLVADRSDRDIKIYDGSGVRTGTIGSAGYGPGEFSGLSSVFAFRGQVAGYDFPESRVTLFDVSGTPTGEIRLDGRKHGQPMYARGVNHDLILTVRHPIDPTSRKLLALVDPKGRMVAEFLDLSSYFGNEVYLRQFSPVRADGHGECVFAGTAGSDSLWVFDTMGEKVASGVVDATRRFRSLAEFFTDRPIPEAAQEPPYPEGSRYLSHVIALPNCRVAVQVAEYGPTPWRLDHLEPGRVTVLEVNGDRLVPVGSLDVSGGLIGRDRDGNALVMNNPTSVSDPYSVSIMHVR